MHTKLLKKLITLNPILDIHCIYSSLSAYCKSLALLILNTCRSCMLQSFFSFIISFIAFYKNTNNICTKSQRSPRVFLLQCKLNFLCQFISNIIVPYEEQQQCQVKYVQRFNVTNALFFCNASPISFAPSSLIILHPMNTAQKAHTEIQHSQHAILLQRKSNFLCSLIVDLIAPYQQQQQSHTEIQRSQRIILLQCRSNLLYPSISKIIPSYEHSNSIKQQLYQCSAQSMCYSSATQVQFPLFLHAQYCSLLWPITIV
eukprot:TRINITY_DN1048_c0_g1_i7.p1 TRINITY_DN1048_c0_g1~~TRINITY_DN1048_c0_g1_i7.p1  ORF type:complete len:280 (+),score=-66.60 TRINITY_DN1048_c0_g1_i7:68-841(+)